MIAPCLSEQTRVAFGTEPNIGSSGTQEERHVKDTPLRYRAQVLDHSLKILDLLAASDCGVKVGALATHLSLHRSTIHRLLSILEHQRFVRREPSRGGYELGMKLFELGRRAVSKLDLATMAVPVLEALAHTIDRDVFVSVLDGNTVLAVASVQCQTSRHRISANLSSRKPVHASAAGKVLTAFLPAERLLELIEGVRLERLTPRTVLRRSSLRNELMHVRQLGFAFEDEELVEGVRALSVPVRNYAGQVVASLTMAAPRARLKRRETAHYVRALTASAADLSQRLGFVDESRGPSRNVRTGT